MDWKFPLCELRWYWNLIPILDRIGTIPNSTHATFSNLDKKGSYVRCCCSWTTVQDVRAKFRVMGKQGDDCLFLYGLSEKGHEEDRHCDHQGHRNKGNGKSVAVRCCLTLEGF